MAGRGEDGEGGGGVGVKAGRRRGCWVMNGA